MAFWELIGPGDRAAMMKSGTVRGFAAGAVLCHQGDPTQNTIVVFSGRVRVSTVTASGDETVQGLRGPGEIIGELAAVDGQPRMATLQAVDPVRGLVIPAPRLAVLCQARPRIAWAMLNVLASRQRAAGNQQDMRSGPTSHRVVAVLLDPAYRCDDGSVRLTQRELASIAGISRETLVRVLKVLRDRDIIQTQRHRIVILDEDALRSL